MKKKVLNSIPYILGIAYLIYCLLNVKSWVQSHTEKDLFFVGLIWAIALFLFIVFLLLSFVKKERFKFYLPLFFFAIGWIIYIVASNTPCCIGG